MAVPQVDEPVPEPPSPDVLQAFREQVTAAFMQAARRYARRRAKLVREAGRRIDPLYHHELVQDALGDIWRGAARWEPERRSLLDQVRDLVKQRTFNDHRKARRRQHISMHAANDDLRLNIEVEMTEAQSSQGDVSLTSLAALMDRIVPELQQLAVRDSAARAILGCWANGIVDSAQVVALTCLSEAAYRKARMRILYLAKYLPPELREAAVQLLRSAS